jgi:predicted RNA polymerase sigma factor
MHPVTPDGRYFAVCGRLWRCTNPALEPEARARLERELMAGRRAKQQAMQAGDAEAREAARQRIDAAKHALGERGPAWWTDGAPDYNRRMARNTPYADWFTEISSTRSG